MLEAAAVSGDGRRVRFHGSDPSLLSGQCTPLARVALRDADSETARRVGRRAPSLLPKGAGASDPTRKASHLQLVLLASSTLLFIRRQNVDVMHTANVGRKERGHDPDIVIRVDAAGVLGAEIGTGGLRQDLYFERAVVLSARLHVVNPGFRPVVLALQPGAICNLLRLPSKKISKPLADLLCDILDTLPHITQSLLSLLILAYALYLAL